MARRLHYANAVRFVPLRHLVLGILVTPSLALAQAVSPIAAGAERLTLDAAIAEALDKNLELIATSAGVTIADANLITAHLRPNPVFSLGGDQR